MSTATSTNLTKHDGQPMDRNPRGVKVRLGDVFRREGQGMKDFMDELKLLTEKDLEDFRGWFGAAGYPCN